MIEAKGDIWKLAHFMRDAIVIPTNIGYKKDGTNPMGKGLAAQAVKRFKDLPITYGQFCKTHGAATPIMIDRFTSYVGGRWLILFPTKPFNPAQPHMSWQGKASLQLIERGLRQLRVLSPPQPRGKIYVPMLGCGWGALRRGDVRQLMDAYLSDGPFVRVAPR